LKSSKRLLLSRVFEEVLEQPSNPDALGHVVDKLRKAFDEPEACWETMSLDEYNNSFPIMSRLLAESIDSEMAREFLGLFRDSGS